PQREGEVGGLVGQRDRLRLGVVFLAALHGDGVLPRRQVEDERVGRERGVHLHAVRVVRALLLVGDGGALLRLRAREVPGALLALGVAARRRGGLRRGVEDLAGEARGLPFPRLVGRGEQQEGEGQGQRERHGGSDRHGGPPPDESSDGVVEAPAYSRLGRK